VAATGALFGRCRKKSSTATDSPARAQCCARLGRNFRGGGTQCSHENRGPGQGSVAKPRQHAKAFKRFSRRIANLAPQPLAPAHLSAATGLIDAAKPAVGTAVWRGLARCCAGIGDDRTFNRSVGNTFVELTRGAANVRRKRDAGPRGDGSVGRRRCRHSD